MNERGFTLLESLVALAILGIALAGVMPVFQGFFDVNNATERRSNSVAAAQEVMEALRQVDPAALPTSGSSPVQTVTVGDHDYEILVRYCTRNEYCNSRSRQIELEVSYAGKTVYDVETVYTRLR